MYATSGTPGWQRDVIWVAGTILVVAAALAAAAVAWSRLADPESAQPLLTESLRATLLPGDGAGAEAPTLAVRADSGIVAGQAFEALPGSGVLIDPSEVPSFDVAAALDRIAGVWSARLLSEGRDALFADTADPALVAQLRRVVDGPGAGLVYAQLSEELMSSGVGDGSRLANWPLQAQQNPGEPVQPMVGVFVFFPADELRGLSDRQIGEAVVTRLARLTLDDGADAAREAITNVNLSARFEQGLAQARTALHELFVAVLSGRGAEIETRLAEARAVQQGQEPAETGLAGLLPASELAGLPTEAANERILAALAERTWRDGPAALDGLLTGDPRGERLAAARTVLASFTRAARTRAVRLAWGAGVVAVLAAAAMMVLARGAGRLARPGAALLIAAAPGALLGWALLRAGERLAAAALPAGARAEGVFATLAGLARYLLGTIPTAASRDVLLVHLVLGGVGAVLLTIAVAMLLGGAVRPRRRGYL